MPDQNEIAKINERFLQARNREYFYFHGLGMGENKRNIFIIPEEVTKTEDQRKGRGIEIETRYYWQKAGQAKKQKVDQANHDFIQWDGIQI